MSYGFNQVRKQELGQHLYCLVSQVMHEHGGNPIPDWGRLDPNEKLAWVEIARRFEEFLEGDKVPF